MVCKLQVARARYVKSGMRIPRRGEVGISAEQIDGLEGLGYVVPACLTA